MLIILTHQLQLKYNLLSPWRLSLVRCYVNVHFGHVRISSQLPMHALLFEGAFYKRTALILGSTLASNASTSACVIRPSSLAFSCSVICCVRGCLGSIFNSTGNLSRGVVDSFRRLLGSFVYLVSHAAYRECSTRQGHRAKVDAAT